MLINILETSFNLIITLNKDLFEIFVFKTLFGFEKLLLSLSAGNSISCPKQTTGINNNRSNFFIIHQK